jgi:hypothetical protein
MQRRPPEAKAQVRILPGAPIVTLSGECPNHNRLVAHPPTCKNAASERWTMLANQGSRSVNNSLSRVMRCHALGLPVFHIDPSCARVKHERPTKLEFDYKITTVDGERGRLLAAEQAAAILEVLLAWFQPRPQPPSQARPGLGNASTNRAAE